MAVARGLKYLFYREDQEQFEGAIVKRLILVLLAIFFVAGAADAHRRNGHRYGHGNGNYGLFYSSLSAHGEWIEVGFGTVWRPYHAGHQWRPYMKGRWMWTDYGWYWNSYEPFGWATYHYGRWIYDDYYGWIWIPDDVWGPAWVEWRYDNDYVGWAPLPPYANFSISVGITFGQAWVAPVHYWNFVPCGNFSSAHVVNYIQPAYESQRIFGRTRSGGTVRTVDRRIVNDGVGLDRIERRSSERIRKVDIVDRAGAGEDRMVKRDGRDRLEVYRPGPEEVRRERTGTRTQEDVKGVRTGQRTQEQVKSERTGQRSQEQVKSERTGQRSQEQVKSERTGQRSQEQVKSERTGQRSQEQVKSERTGQRSLNEEMREKVSQRDRQRETGKGEAEKAKPEVKRERPAQEKQKLEIKRPKPEGRSGRDG
jgi:hypothetical protein